MFDCVSKTSLWPVNKKNKLSYLILHYMILYTLIDCPIFIDIKQTLDQIHFQIFFMHYCLMFVSHFFAG